MSKRASPKRPTPAAAATGGRSIGEVADATGIAPDTIRVWERRYGRPRPVRLPSGHRRYTDEQVRWLRRVTEALARGHRPSRAVRATESELEAMLAGEDEQVAAGREIARLIDLVRTYDAAGLVESLAAAREQLGPRAFLMDRVAPLLHRVGRLWADGELDVRHEHFVSEVLEDHLRGLRAALEAPPGSGLVLLATLPGEEHTLGLQMAALVCAEGGFATRILGRRTPLPEIARAARETRALAVAVSISLASGGVKTDRELAVLRKALPAGIQLLAGGAGARGVRRGVRGVRYMSDLDALRAWTSTL